MKCFSRSDANVGHNGIEYFYGFKLHCVTNLRGKLLRFALTPGNDHDLSLIKRGLVTKVQGTLVGDGAYYASGTMQQLEKKGLILLARPPKTKLQELPAYLRRLLGKRWRIETTFGRLKKGLGLEHHGCRTKNSFLATVHAVLCAYQLELTLKRA